MILTLTLFLIIVACVLCYRNAPLWMWTSSYAVLLIVLTKWCIVSTACLVFAWIPFVLLFVPLQIPFLRRKFFTDRIFVLFKTMLPGMSTTEKEAIDAGTVWWDGDLFNGNPDWNKLLNIPFSRLSEEEQAFIDGETEELCAMLDDWDITDNIRDLPPNAWDFIKSKKFFGMIIPKEYGGLGFSSLARSAVVMKLSSRSISAAVDVMVPNSLGPAELILKYGTKEQKEHYLPRLANGTEVPCFALTGPLAGSDAGSMPDTGILCRGDFGDEKNVLGVKLNWEKRYITLGPVASVLGLAFKMYDPEALLGDKVDIGITLALVPTNISGIKIGTRHAPLNSVFQVGPTWGKDVFIPVEMLIGGESRRGQGWRMLMECLAEGRSISLPALGTGTSKLVSRAIGAYARVRKQFNMPIGKFEGIEEALARIAGYTYIVDSARLLTASGVDLGEKPSVVSAIVKYHSTEMARKAINDGMDVQGGGAICMGPRNLLARIYQSIPICITVEGANILTRSLIIFGQGAIRCHPYVVKEMLAAEEEDKEKGASLFDPLIMKHTGFGISNAVRALVLGLTGSRIASAPSFEPIKIYYKHLSRMSAAFAICADTTMLLLGASLKRKEGISARFGDILSHLYLASSVLKRFNEDGLPLQDLPLVHWSCQTSLFTIQDRFDGILRNLPNPYVAAFLRILVFPLGKPFKAPDDRLTHKVASLLLSPSETRERLTGGIYAPKDTGERMGVLEDALLKVIAAEDVERQIKEGIQEGLIKKGSEEAMIEDGVKAGVITRDEAEIVYAAAAARDEVVRVDDFPQGM